MKSDNRVKYSIAFIIIAMVIWTGVVFYSIGLDVIWAVMRGDSKAQIESFGQLGASYGVLAALFAGLAVVFLWQSISVQQEELHQLREQMEHDRSIREYTWLVDVFRNARSRISKFPEITSMDRMAILNGKTVTKNPITADAYIEYLARIFIECRESNDYYTDLIFSMKNCETGPLGIDYSEILNPVNIYISSVQQIALYISKNSIVNRDVFLSMFASVTTQHDLIVIHDQVKLRNNILLTVTLEEIGLLGVHGDDLYAKLEGGPRLKPSAFGIHAVEVSHERDGSV